MISPKTRLFHITALLTLLMAPARAQPANIPVPNPVVTLSPFEVSAAADEGYAATHSLAGGRVNTELIKTPADVTVLTREFLADIGATDYLQAAGYLTSAVTTWNGTTDHGTTVEFRGMPAGVQTRNFFSVRRAMDMYIVDRLEAMRGPNSLLFGAGSVGGVLNTMTKRANPSRAFGETTLRLDSEGSRYAAFDLNRPMGANTAVRLNVFGQQNRFWLDRKFDDRSAVHLAALHRPWARGELRFEGEFGDSSTNYPPQFFRDNHSNYVSGYAVTGPLAVASPAPGVNRITTATLVWSPTMAPGVVNLLNFGRSTGRNLAISPEVREVFPTVPAISRDLSLQPRNGTADIRHYLFAGYFEQQWSRRLVSEFAVQYAHVGRDAKNTKFDGLYLDPNAVLPNGAPNPRFGEFYSEKAWSGYNQDSQHIDARAALVYDLGFTRWKQRLNLMVFHRQEITDYETYRIGRNNNPANPLLSAAVNEPLFRIYASDPEPRWVMPPNDATYQWEAWSGIDQRVTNTFNSIQLATVASIWDDRLSIVAGVRTDDWHQKQRDGGARDAAGRFTSITWQELSGVPTTSSSGFVFFPIHAIGIYGNHAETFNQATGGGDGLFGQSFGPTTARSYSGGLRFRLAKDRIVGSVGYYELREAGRLIQYQSGPINRTWVSLNKGELQVNPELGNYRDTVDYTGSGVELDLTANFGRSLRLRGNFAMPRTRQTNTVPGLRAYYATHIAEWRAGAADPQNPNRTQINTDITALNTVLSNADEGRVLNNTPDYTGSVFGMYTFASTALKRLRVGGGVTWQGPRVIGNQVNRPFDYVKSDGYYLVNLSAGYPFKWRERAINLQLNVSNLLDSSDPIYTGTAASGALSLRTGFHFVDARKAQLTATLRF